MGDYYGPDWLKEYVQAFWYPEEFLHEEWSKEKQEAFDNLYDVNIFGWTPFKNEFDRILGNDEAEKYMDRNGLDYSDIKDPRKFHNSFSVSNFYVMSNSLNFVSKNLGRLYK